MTPRRRPARRHRTLHRVFTQKNDSIPVFPRYGRDGLTIVRYGILCAPNPHIGRLGPPRLRLVSLRIHEHDAVVEITAPDARPPRRRRRTLAPPEIDVVLIEPDHSVVSLRRIRKAVIPVIQQSGPEAVAHGPI